jgi:hypothetical protein
LNEAAGAADACGVIECGNIGTDAGCGWHMMLVVDGTFGPKVAVRKYQNSIQNP